MSYKKERLKHLSEDPTDHMASQRFRQPPYHAARLIRAQTCSTRNCTLRELLDYLIDGVDNGRLSGAEPVPDEIVEYIHGGHIDTLEYLAEKYDISGGDASGQNSAD